MIRREDFLQASREYAERHDTSWTLKGFQVAGRGWLSSSFGDGHSVVWAAGRMSPFDHSTLWPQGFKRPKRKG